MYTCDCCFLFLHSIVSLIQTFRQVFRKPSGTFRDAGFERVTYEATYGLTYGSRFYYLRKYLGEATYRDREKGPCCNHLISRKSELYADKEHSCTLPVLDQSTVCLHLMGENKSSNWTIGQKCKVSFREPSGKLPVSFRNMYLHSLKNKPGSSQNKTGGWDNEANVQLPANWMCVPN